MTPMADEPSTPGPFPASMQEFISQFFAPFAGQAASAGPSAQPGASALPGPLPGALSAAQMNAITESIANQRRSIKTLQTQLSTFDEQLAALESFLGPLAQWSRSWADVEQRFLGRKPEADG
jgi:hypothetical protein